MFTVSKIGCNLCRFWNNDTQTMVILEFDYNLSGFREKSDYKVTQKYCYNSRRYDRTKPANISRYYRILSLISPKEYSEAYKLFE